jgi:2-C-methyl-D-erythritol 4-phosphate cytidylyltransferase
MRIRSHAIIVAGGIGMRFGDSLPKQFALIGGQPVLNLSVNAFLAFDPICSITVVSHRDWMSYTCSMLEEIVSGPVILRVVEGGDCRQMSCRNGIRSIQSSPEDIVFIHDSARPIFPHSLITQLFTAAQTVGAAVPCLASSESLLKIDGNLVSEYLDRSKIQRVQTPQAFQYRILNDIYLTATDDDLINATDDGSLVHHGGFPVACVPGDQFNLKITTPADLIIAEKYFEFRDK